MPQHLPPSDFNIGCESVLIVDRCPSEYSPPTRSVVILLHLNLSAQHVLRQGLHPGKEVGSPIFIKKQHEADIVKFQTCFPLDITYVCKHFFQMSLIHDSPGPIVYFVLLFRISCFMQFNCFQDFCFTVAQILADHLHSALQISNSLLITHILGWGLLPPIQAPFASCLNITHMGADITPIWQSRKRTSKTLHGSYQKPRSCL